MPTLSDGTTVYTDCFLRSGTFGVDTYEAQREAFDAALLDLFAALYYGSGGSAWTGIRELDREAEGFQSVEAYADSCDLFGSGRGYVERHNRRLLVQALRRLFRNVLTRRAAPDGRFLWCHVEETYPPLAERVMDHADHGSAFPLSKAQKDRVADQIRFR